MATIAKRKLTYADYLNTPDDDTYYELIDGELIKFHTPNIAHQSAVGDLLVALGTLMRDTGMGEVFQI